MIYKSDNIEVELDIINFNMIKTLFNRTNKIKEMVIQDYRFYGIYLSPDIEYSNSNVKVKFSIDYYYRIIDCNKPSLSEIRDRKLNILLND
jgi:hypothetical protein